MSRLIDLRNEMRRKTEACTNCDKRISAESKLDNHTITHEGRPQFDCSKCEQSFCDRTPTRAHTILKLENEIADIEAEENRNIVIENFKKLSENPENVNIKEVWKHLRNVFPKFKPTLAIAKRNFKGKIITDLEEIKDLLIKE